MRRLCLLLPAAALGIATAAAADISPSRDNVPNAAPSQSTSRFSIFSGDPARIQRANSVDFRDFTPTLVISPVAVSLAERKAQGALATDGIKASFSLQNNGKRTYTLSFPNAERYDLTVKDPKGRLVYQWSLDKKFVEEVGLVMVNPTDKIGYLETLSLSDFYAPLEVGVYKVEATMANYPEIHAVAKLEIRP
jgi:hypothetical protein